MATYNRQAQRAQIPREGARSCPIVADFTQYTDFDIPILLTAKAGFMSLVVMLFCDNSGNTEPVRLISSVLNQRLIIPAGAMAYLPFLCPQNVTIAAHSLGSVPVGFDFINVPMPALVWFPGGGGPPIGDFRITMVPELRVTEDGSPRVISIAPLPPVFNSDPFITGNPVEPNTLTGHIGSIANDPTAFVYQWYLDTTAAPIGGATGLTILTDGSQAGHSLIFGVTASNVAGSAQAFSPPLSITASGGGTIAIPDMAALFAAFGAGPGSTGGKTWILAGVDFGSGGDFSHYDFTSNPIIIQGTAGSRFAYIHLDFCNGMTWQDFNCYSNDGLAGIHVSNSQHQTFVNVTAKTGAPVGGPYSGLGIVVRDCSFISFTGTVGVLTIQGQGTGVALQTGFDHISFQAVSVAEFETDGMIAGGPFTTPNPGPLTVNQWLCYDAYPQPGDHPDALQFFGGVQDATITNSMYFQGVGGQSQGFTGEDSINVRYDTCVVFGGMAAGIAAARGDTGVANNCFCQGTPSDSRIILRNGAPNWTLSNNQAQFIGGYAPEAPYPGLVLSGNTIIPDASGPSDYTDLDPFLTANPLVPPRPY